MADITNCWVEVGLCGALPWTNTNSYKSGALAHHDGRVWAAKTDIPTGQPAPGLVPGAWFPITGQVTYITENKPTLIDNQAQHYGFVGPTYPDPTSIPPQTGDLIFSTATGEICYVSRDQSGAFIDTLPVPAP